MDMQELGLNAITPSTDDIVQKCDIVEEHLAEWIIEFYKTNDNDMLKGVMFVLFIYKEPFFLCCVVHLCQKVCKEGGANSLTRCIMHNQSTIV